MLAVFDLIRKHRPSAAAVICAFDLIEFDGEDLRREPSETRKSTLKSMLRGNCGCGPGVEGVATRALRAWSRVPSVISQFPSYFAVKIVSASVGYARSGELAWHCCLFFGSFPWAFSMAPQFATLAGRSALRAKN